MQTPLGEHIHSLQTRLETLAREMMDANLSLEERNGLEAEIRVVNLALAHYRAAIELETAIQRK